MTSGRDGSLVVHRPSQTRDAAPDGVTNGDVPLRVGERECAAHSPTRNAVDCTRVAISPLVLSFKLAWHLVFRLTAAGMACVLKFRTGVPLIPTLL